MGCLEDWRLGGASQDFMLSEDRSSESLESQAGATCPGGFLWRVGIMFFLFVLAMALQFFAEPVEDFIVGVSFCIFFPMLAICAESE